MPSHLHNAEWPTTQVHGTPTGGVCGGMEDRPSRDDKGRIQPHPTTIETRNRAADRTCAFIEGHPPHAPYQPRVPQPLHVCLTPQVVCPALTVANACV